MFEYLSETFVSINSAMSNEMGKFTIVGFFSTKNRFSVNLDDSFGVTDAPESSSNL